MNTIQNKKQSAIIVSSSSNELYEVESEIKKAGYHVLPMSEFDKTDKKSRILLVLSKNSQFDTKACEFIKSLIENSIPIITVYPEKEKLSDIHDNYGFTHYVTNLWNKIPIFKSERHQIPVVHVPLSKVIQVMNNSDFKVGSTVRPSDYYMIDKSEM